MTSCEYLIHEVLRILFHNNSDNYGLLPRSREGHNDCGMNWLT